MADDKLIFPIGFDLEEGVKKAGRDWKNHYRKRLQDAIDSRPLKVKIDFESKGIDTKEFKQWMVLSREAEKLERERIKNAKEWQKVADQAAMAETRRANATNESNARIERANRKAEASENRKKDAVERTNSAYKTQSTYLTRLAQRMIAYATVSQVLQFLRNVREVTAQFELQRVALGSIIGDLNTANTMFEQIKAAAVKSPFQIKELVSYTKQLAAYKIETDELFETTQKLADVSAGLGVGMERLVLAYGQIRATGYLRASEVRQLTEAGIPIIEELAKKMSQLRGETISAAEVMGMISERAISFGMVKEVFDDMTSAGGMFYKMQEKQAEPLAGQISNLKDSFAIMYDEIGRSENVNSTIKSMIGLVKSLAENWRDVYSVAQSLSVAMGVYYVTMKNAAIASKALSIAEATRLSTLRATTIYMPKFLASTKLAITLTHAYRVAVIKSATATGLLSKAFWGLTKAMLSNPYTAILAALAGLTVAIVKFASQAVQADDAIKGINASLSEFERHATATDELMEKYNRLAGTTNRTAKEQKEYQETLNELGKMYPDAIDGMDKYGNVLDLNSERLAEASTLQREFNRDLAETQIQLAESLIPKLEEEIDDARNALGKRFFSYWGNYSKEWKFGLFSGDKDQTELLDLIASMRAEIEKLKKSADEARKKLAGITEDGDGKNLSDTFNTWQKELASITEGKNLKGEGIRVFDDESIAQTPKLTSALEKVAEKYKKLKEEKKQVDKALLSEGAKADKQTYSQLEQRLGKINEGMSGLYDFLEKYGGLDLIKGGDKGGELARLQKELQLHEKIYAKYKEYRKYMSAEEAKAKVEDYFGDTIDALKFKPSFDKSGYQNVLEQYKKAANTLLAKAKDETEKGAIKKFLLDIGFKIDDKDWEETKDDIEKNLKKLSDDLSRTKTAKEFFDRMLGMTGDKQLSATLTLSIYGTTGDDLKSALVKQVQGAFAGQDLSKAINTDLNSIDLSALREIYNNLPEDFQEKQKQSMKQVLDMLEKGQHDLANNFAKLLMDYDEMEQKRVTITQKATQEIATLEQGLDAQIEGIRKNKKITDKDSAIAQAKARAETVRKAILAREKLELSKLSPEYIRFFSSINAMTRDAANKTRTELRRALFEAFEKGAMSAEELRKELKAIDTQFNKLNQHASAFVAYIGGGFDSMLKKLQDSADEMDAIGARMMKLQSIEQMDKGDANFVDKMLNVFGNKGQQSLSDLVTSFNGDMTQMGQTVQQVGGQMQGMFGGAMGAIALIDVIVKAIGQTISAIQDMIDELNSLRTEDNQIGGWFRYISDFDKYVQRGWESLKSGNPADTVAATFGSWISIIRNVQIDKIKKLDEEIETQQDLLDDLSYQYERLQKASEESFGTEYIQNYNNQLSNLNAQLDAYQKQLDAERGKGKKTDEDKVKDYLKQIRDAQDAIDDMYGTLSEHFLGQDLSSAVRDFANACLEAYKAFSNTTDAMKEKFQDMIQNMIVESLLAKVMERALEPVFTMIDEMGDADFYNPSFWDELMGTMAKATEDGVVGAENVMSMLEQMGVSIRGFGGDLTGISRDIATASEESILGLAAGINTQNFYISQVPPKLDVIIGLLQGGNLAQGSAITLQDLVTIQNQHLSYLPSIAQHTAETVAECKQIVAETRRTADALERVIKPRGTQATHTLNATIN